jgi:hypothetical protein
MNRRKAILGILSLTGTGFVSVTGFKYLIGSSYKKGNLEVHMNLIAELVDVIIPPTTSPGAKSARVQDYVFNYMQDCSNTKEYNSFINGLTDLQEASNNKYKQNFELCTLEQKTEILEDLSKNWNSKGLLLKVGNKLLGRSFFDSLKTLTIEGYCTSLAGATKHLEYSAIPGKYIAVTQLESNQKAWATK